MDLVAHLCRTHAAHYYSKEHRADDLCSNVQDCDDCSGGPAFYTVDGGRGWRLCSTHATRYHTERSVDSDLFASINDCDDCIPPDDSDE